MLFALLEYDEIGIKEKSLLPANDHPRTQETGELIIWNNVFNLIRNPKPLHLFNIQTPANKKTAAKTGSLL